MRKLIIVIFSFFLLGAAPVRQYTYTSGDPIDPDEVMANEDAIFNYLSVGVEIYKDGTIYNADINSAANIQSDKLNLSDIVGAVAFGTGGSLLIPASTSTPATCSTGQIYFDTDATSGSNIYGCISTNTWALQSGGGGTGSGDVTGVGDCSGGACLDGTSDGGTFVRLYDGNSHYTQVTPADTSSSPTITLPSSTSTLLSTTSSWTGGDLGGTGLAPSVTDDSHLHTTTSISGIDISSDTNLAVSGSLLTLNNDTVTFAQGTMTDTKFCIYTTGVGIVCNSEGGSGGAPSDATYITQTANATLSAEQALGSLATGLLKNTTTTGVLSIATAGTDYASGFTTSAGLAGILNDETGTGVAVFGTAPTFTSQITTPKILSASSATLTLSGSGGTYNENLTLNFDSATNEVAVGSGTGVEILDFGAMDVETTGTALVAGITYNGSDQYINVSRAANKTTPSEGDTWYNSTTNAYYFYDGTSNLIIATTSSITGSGLTAADLDTPEELRGVMKQNTGTGSLVYNNTPTMTGLTVNTSLDIPSNGTIDAEGEIGVDTTDDQFVYYGGAKRIVSYKNNKAILAETVTSSDTYLTVYVAVDPTTLLSANCIVDPEENSATDQVNFNFKECDSTGDNCQPMLTGGLTCDNDGATSSTFTNATLDANDYMIVSVNAVTGTATKVFWQFGYTLDAE